MSSTVNQYFGKLREGISNHPRKQQNSDLRNDLFLKNILKGKQTLYSHLNTKFAFLLVLIQVINEMYIVVHPYLIGIVLHTF